MNKSVSILAAALVAGSAGLASGSIRITEYMYQGAGGTGEFFELTNLGNAAIDLTGWRMIDDLPFNEAGPSDFFDLSFFGLVAAGESIIITEDTADFFRTNWNLDSSVRVLGGLGVDSGRNLGRNDAVVIYDANDNIVDQLFYGDQNFPGSIRTRFASGNPLAGAIGADDPFGWVLSVVGDEFGSYMSLSGDIGNPGFYIPAPGAVALLGFGGLMAGRRRR